MPCGIVDGTSIVDIEDGPRWEETVAGGWVESLGTGSRSPSKTSWTGLTRVLAAIGFL